jgi:hypothetical protein
MSLYEDLESEGWCPPTYPRRNIDKLASKYKLIGYFYRPQISVDRRFLCKYGLCIFFDLFHVDIIENGYTLMTFGKESSREDIMIEIRKLEKQKDREYKLSRILKK